MIKSFNKMCSIVSMFSLYLSKITLSKAKFVYSLAASTLYATVHVCIELCEVNESSIHIFFHDCVKCVGATLMAFVASWFCDSFSQWMDECSHICVQINAFYTTTIASELNCVWNIFGLLCMCVGL